ncbi:dTDP-4-dehydrorhamnose reductase [Candidatus Pandoraea novymonadis]|uniref:dTDP-4-dehydrorhamnose reductase n=1 Tax=Candidatus Pandoraea novymonadis TaxID=1808959 RepID=A0ABX5FEJ5_9BURK|nr:dTDP-4-dehydrorhamnose reductase [Candidatus Pandoraea novymonadis]PSB92133.1 dTDP-4-dehydrorhamnose reductase [Candidatus Pandoraea novymonadis]
MVRRILITGATGQVGWELKRTLQGVGDVHAPTHTQFDLNDFDNMVRVIHAYQPHLIVNTAAYTAVDRAEQSQEDAYRINGEAPGVLADEAKKIGALLVHYSTDYVFAGTAKIAYREDNAAAPQSVYGHTKLAGEAAIVQSGANYLILRTSWVYGMRGNNFLLKVLRVAREGRELRIVADQIGVPTWCRTLAEMTAQIIVQGFRDGGIDPNFWQVNGGIYHLTSQGQTSWYGFAKAILSRTAFSIQPVINSISTADYISAAKRPAYSVLNTDKLARTFGLRAPHWCAALDLCLR